MLACFFYYTLLLELTRVYNKGLRLYVRQPGNYYEIAILGITAWIYADTCLTEYRFPDLSGPDAPYILLKVAARSPTLGAAHPPARLPALPTRPPAHAPTRPRARWHDLAPAPSPTRPLASPGAGAWP